jgi:hypothetical protein
MYPLYSIHHRVSRHTSALVESARRYGEPMARIRDRSTGDLLVLMIAGTVCFMVLATGASIVVIEIVNPSADTSSAVRQVTGIINTLIGLLAGFLAGRTDLSMQQTKKTDPKDETTKP